MDFTCGMNGGKRERHAGFGGETSRKETTYKTGLDILIILK
jgi:hypothetical protein